MTNEAGAKWPGAYFPSIEKTCGQPVAHWFKLLDAVRDRKHMEQVAFPKMEHQTGHGHANALVAFHKARRIRDRCFNAPSARRACAGCGGCWMPASR